MTKTIQAHIFFPFAISFSLSRLATNQSRGQNEVEAVVNGFQFPNNELGHGLSVDTQTCLNALQKMQSFNNLAKEHLGMTGNPDFTTDLTQCLQ